MSLCAESQLLTQLDNGIIVAPNLFEGDTVIVVEIQKRKHFAMTENLFRHVVTHVGPVKESYRVRYFEQMELHLTKKAQLSQCERALGFQQSALDECVETNRLSGEQIVQLSANLQKANWWKSFWKKTALLGTITGVAAGSVATYLIIK